MKNLVTPLLTLVAILCASTVAKAQTETKSQTETLKQTQTETKPSVTTETNTEEESDSTRKLFDFSENNSDAWQIVNDGVMGGLSSSKVDMVKDNEMKFSGTISLENNGGFASVRSKTKDLELKDGDELKLRVKGDGRKYTFNLYVPTTQVAFSYQKDFDTKADEWAEIKLPLSEFQAKSFGRPVDQPLDPASVNSIGLLLGDKKAGDFHLVIDWVKVASAEE